MIRKMRFSEIAEVNNLINETLKSMDGLAKTEYLRIKIENNIPLLFLRKLLMPENILVYEKRKRIAGTIAYSGNLIGNLFVHPKEQGMGIGTALLAECEKIISKKFNSVRIYSYKGAVKLHKKRGYKIKNSLIFLMEKKLR